MGNVRGISYTHVKIIFRNVTYGKRKRPVDLVESDIYKMRLGWLEQNATLRRKTQHVRGGFKKKRIRLVSDCGIRILASLFLSNNQEKPLLSRTMNDSQLGPKKKISYVKIARHEGVS